jgi:magnesium transporter
MIEFFVFSKKQGLRRHTDPNLLQGFLKDEEETIWVDFETPTDNESEVLSTVFNFHPLAVEDCIAESHLPKLDDYGDYLFLVIHGARRGESPGTFNTVDVNFFVGKRYLVTFHPSHTRSVDQTKERCQKNTQILSKGIDFLLYEIMDRLVDNYFPILDDFDVVIDELEYEAFHNPTRATLDRIFSLKRDVTALRRITGPQREIFNRLSRDSFAVISRRAAPYFRDVYDHLFRISDLAESYKDLGAGLMEAYLMVVSNRLNEIIKVLTLIATIMLPLTLITGIYGMNFEYMPEIKWRYGYFFVIGFMALVGFGLLYYFRKRRWI